VLNPLVAEGQVHGGVVQGIGQAMLEEMKYDESGNCLTSTYADYLIPDATMVPEIRWERTETPTDANILGIKGIGETGTIAATPAVVNAVEDAFAGRVRVSLMPLSPSNVWNLIQSMSSQAQTS
jgi:xanthine dehydrogenase, molybdenum binding subunit apoprotein (EC 1.17.1.4)